MMSRKDYQAMAAIVRRRVDEADEQATLGAFAGRRRAQELASEMADYFKSDNSRFDRQKFMEACGL